MTINDCEVIIMSSLGNLQTNSEAKANIYAQYISDLQRSIRLGRSEPARDSNDDHDQRATNLEKAV